ncbi:hypothetical protein [Nonomuraea rubra]|uniref:hypothetical protein n=1 Tax=Nonomuraea rubra TaxID=46180 RepID=UPI0031ED3D92
MMSGLDADDRDQHRLPGLGGLLGDGPRRLGRGPATGRPRAPPGVRVALGGGERVGHRGEHGVGQALVRALLVDEAEDDARRHDERDRHRMNTMSLNAVAHLMRSVSTAKIRPSVVTMIARAMTQISVVRIVVSMP